MHKLKSVLLTIFLGISLVGCSDKPATVSDAKATLGNSLITSSGLIYEEAPFPSAHASTIVETPAGMVSSWFGGTAEKNPDVGIWVSRNVNGQWTAPIEVANGIQPEGNRHPTWNPVLFQPADGPLVLFYKAGPTPQSWWGLVRTSSDNGLTWSEEGRLPDGIYGPIRAKPVLMEDGSLLAGSSSEHAGWVVHMERLLKPASGSMWDLDYLINPDSWEIVSDLNDPDTFGAIQPTILVHSPNQLQILCRSRQDVITEAWSSDGGKSWAPMQATSLPNPSAGIDAISLQDGRFLLIYNPTTEGREKLALAISDDGNTWNDVTLLENSEGEYSYPAMVQAEDGMIHITYTWRRERVKYVSVDPTQIL
ncbi:MAG: exo-alpha-sialidase [Rhodothermales bacterium]